MRVALHLLSPVDCCELDCEIAMSLRAYEKQTGMRHDCVNRRKKSCQIARNVSVGHDITREKRK